MIRVVTFLTNHCMVADIQDNNSEYIIMKTPVQIVAGTSVGSYVFVPFLEHTKDFESGIRVSKEHILCITEPVMDVYNNYQSRFGSGITLATSLQ